MSNKYTIKLITTKSNKIKSGSKMNEDNKVILKGGHSRMERNKAETT